MGLEDEEADRHRGIGLIELRVVAAEQLRQRDEVPEGLAHLLPVDRNHIVMDPIMDTLRAAGSDILRNFAFMVREHQVHTAAVDVELVTEVFFAHHGAFEVPAREAVAPRGRPAHNMLRLSLFPDRKIVRRLLVALPVKGARPFEGRLEIATGKDAVLMVLIVFFDVKIDGAVRLVGIASLENLFDRLDLLDDVTGSAGLDRRGLAAEQAHRFVVALGVVLDYLHRLQLLQPCLLRNLVLTLVGIVLQMPHVRNVADIADLVTEVFQQPEKHVVCDTGTGVAQVRVAVDGRAADVHTDVAFVDRLEQFFVTGKGIG